MLWPAMVAVGAAVRLESNGPAFFVQDRVGRDGETFRIYKFRTMVQGSEKGDVGVTEGDARVTRVGSLLRRTSLDELPQLLNILKGEMSVVGPRPTLGYQVEQYDGTQRRRLDVLPGVTGWAQVRYSYVNEMDGFLEKLSYDLYYMKHRSAGMNLVVLWQTIKTVVLFRGL